MKKIQLLTIIAWLFLPFSIFLWYQGNVVYSLLLIAVAYLLSGKEMQTHTGILQTATMLITSLALGFLLEFHFNRIPFIGLACFLTNIPVSLRIIFFRKFIMTRFLWVEALGTGSAAALYLLGNYFYYGSADWNWQYAVFPLAPIGFTGGIAFGMFVDTPGLLKARKKGYLADIGKTAPDFLLPDQDGKLVSLADFRGQRNLLLIFVRGDWCPWCHMMLRTYQKEAKSFLDKNILLLTIGPDPVGTNKNMSEKLGIEFRVLSDDKQAISSLYGCQVDPGNDKNLLSTNPVYQRYEKGIPLPASFLVDRNGIVRYTSRPDQVGDFLDLSTIFPILESLN